MEKQVTRLLRELIKKIKTGENNVTSLFTSNCKIQQPLNSKLFNQFKKCESTFVKSSREEEGLAQDFFFSQRVQFKYDAILY